MSLHNALQIKVDLCASPHTSIYHSQRSNLVPMPDPAESLYEQPKQQLNQPVLEFWH
jgi:hypothetical protein